MTARHELQVELKKLEGDYEQKLRDLSQEKEQLATSKQEREKENEGLQQQLSSLNQQVHTQSDKMFYTETINRLRAFKPNYGCVKIEPFTDQNTLKEALARSIHTMDGT